MNLKVDIIDTGIGMNEATLHRPYQPFMQADESSSRMYQGTGLGLSIVHSLVQSMGASIQVTSTPAVGTTFTLDFCFAMAQVGDAHTPLQELPQSAAARSHLPPPKLLQPHGSATSPTAAHAPAAAPPARAAPIVPTKKAPHAFTAEAPLHGAQVAVVDDQQLNRRIARLMLEKAGATAYEFEDGSALLNALRTPLGDQLHAVLMDLQMEPMDGLQTTRLIRAETQASWHTLPIIAMTGNLMEEENMATEKAGMNGFLSKPLNYETFIEQLRIALNKTP